MGSVFLGVERRDPTALRAIKRAHPHLADDAGFRRMFSLEAKLAGRIDHANVVGVLDVEETDGELLLIMPYIEGAAFSELQLAARDRGSLLPAPISLRIVIDAARGLHAAHRTADADGKPLGIVHRDVSPHNILVGVDGVARIADFGVAKALGTQEATVTASDVLKGKLGFMSPEYLRDQTATPRSDVFSLGIVAWEALTGERLFRGANDGQTIQRILDPAEAKRASDVVDVDRSIADVLARALAKDPSKRYETAGELADDLEEAARLLRQWVDTLEIAAVVRYLMGNDLKTRRELLSDALERWESALASFEERRTAKILIQNSMGLGLGATLGTPKGFSGGLRLGPSEGTPTVERPSAVPDARTDPRASDAETAPAASRAPSPPPPAAPAPAAPSPAASSPAASSPAVSSPAASSSAGLMGTDEDQFGLTTPMPSDPEVQAEIRKWQARAGKAVTVSGQYEAAAGPPSGPISEPWPQAPVEAPRSSGPKDNPQSLAAGGCLIGSLAAAVTFGLLVLAWWLRGGGLP
jgi:serine/threonine-protein kinase